MSHESRTDECDIGFSSEIYIGIHQLGNNFFLISLKENKLGCLPFVNRTRLFGSFHWKISGSNGTSEKPGSPVFPLETFRWKLRVSFTSFEGSYQFQTIHGHILILARKIAITGR